MAWIESHQELGRHPKTRKLARLLGISIPQAIGHLHLFWWWAMDFAQDGTITKFDPEEIADASLWDGDALKFQGALIQSGFLDETPESVTIHDWYDYAGKLIERRKSDALRKRSSRLSEDVQETSNGHPTDTPGKSERVHRNRTLPNSTVPNSTQPYSSAVSVNGYQKSSSSKPAPAGKTRAHARTTTTFLKNLNYAEQARWVADVPDDLQASWSVADRRAALEDMLAKCKEMHWTPHEKSYHEWLRNEKKHVPENASEVEKWTAILASFDKETGKCSNGQSWNFVNDELQDAKRRERSERERRAYDETKLVYLESSHPEPSS